MDDLAVITAYRNIRIVREVARSLGVSRGVVERRLRENEVPILARDKAYALYRQLSALTPAVETCRWPACRDLVVLGGLCVQHADAVPAFANRCVWPGCEQMPYQGALCGPHQKRASEGMR